MALRAAIDDDNKKAAPTVVVGAAQKWSLAV